jgi:hypothetical protein
MHPLYTYARIAFLSLLLFATGYTTKAQWCTTNFYYYACYYDDYVLSVSTTGGATNINNLNTFCNNFSTGYTYFSTQTVTAMAGGSFNYSIVNNNAYPEYYAMWIDYNNNGLFTDAGEQIFNNGFTTGTTSPNNTINGSVTIPSGTTPGTKRLRVRCVYDTGPITPCGFYYFGEVEDYNCVVTAACPAPAISSHPQNRVTCEGGSTSFTVAASNASTYQWQVNTGAAWANVSGSVYSGANTTSLSLTNIPLSYNNYQYRCVVTGACNNPVNSNPATISVNSGAAITSQTLSDTICRGASTSMSVSTIGTVSGYQWQMAVATVGVFFNVPNAPPFSGVNTANLVITKVPDSLNGYIFRCVVVGGLCPNINSSNIPITVLIAPEVVDQPDNDTIYPYNNATFDIAGTAGANLVYYWQASADGINYSNINNNSLYQNVTTPILTVKAATPAMANWRFRCIIKATDPACGIFHDTSQAAQLIMIFPDDVSTVNGSQQFEIKVYPNPVAGAELFVQAEGLVSGIFQARVLDKLGRTVFTKDVELSQGKIVTIPAAQLAPGVYSLQLTDKEGNVSNTTKFTKQ